MAGIISFLLIPAFGWRSVFYVGGIVPLLTVPFLVWGFPESIRFLALKKKNAAQIARILRTISPSGNFSAEDQYVLNEQRASRSTISSLFTEGRAPVTLLLFAIFFICLLEMYFFNQWLPSLLQQSGIPIKRALFVGSIFGVGGVLGGFVGGWLSKRFDSSRVLGSIFVGACLSVIALGLSHGHPLAIIVVAFFAGFFTNGATVVEMAVAASVYPTAIRGTGLGWALGVGRIGTIIGPTLAGILLATGIATPKLFILSAIPVAIGAVAAFVLTGIRRRQAATQSTVVAAAMPGR
jgi:AAHS family 4-hydroxybenzoate transporter-like MFS transporter